MYNPAIMLFRWVCLLAIGSVPALANSVCITDSLANYESLVSTGCQIGTLTVKDFSFTPVSGVPILDTNITVTPTTGPQSLTLTFTSGLLAPLTGTSSTIYVIGYTWDPGDIRSLEDILNANSPVFPGLAKITTVDCQEAGFIGPICPTSVTNTLVVSDNGNTLISPVSVSFSPSVGILGIRNTVELDANNASSEFTSFSNQLTLPEPSTGWMVLLSVLLLCGVRRLQGGQLRGELAAHLGHRTGLGRGQ